MTEEYCSYLPGRNHRKGFQNHRDHHGLLQKLLKFSKNEFFFKFKVFYKNVWTATLCLNCMSKHSYTCFWLFIKNYCFNISNIIFILLLNLNFAHLLVVVSVFHMVRMFYCIILTFSGIFKNEKNLNYPYIFHGTCVCVYVSQRMMLRVDFSPSSM